MRSTAIRLCCAACVAAPLSAQNYYESAFDHLLGSPAGIAVAGRDGLVVPPTVPVSADGAIYSYAGNVLQIPTQNDGGANFLGLDASVGPAQVERTTNIPIDCHTHIEFDIYVRYVGTGAPSGVIGGFSLQPTGPAATMNLIARWPANSSAPPTTWNADIVVGPGANGVAVPVPDPHFQNLAVNRWYRWGCSVHVAMGEYTLLVIDDLAGGRFLFQPPAGTMMVNAQGAPPSAFRLSALGAQCQVAFDRVSVAYHGMFMPFGVGCAGTLGVPQLQDFNGSRPVLSLTFQARLSNLPFDVGAIAWGFSNTLWGSVPLPADLTPAGMPGCLLQVEPAQTDIIIGTAGAAVWSAFVPDIPTLMGLDFYAQGASLDPAANAAGIAVSNPGHGCVGR